MLKKIKPSLIISTPGIAPSERIIFEIANILNIPTVDIQHGLMGDKRGREIVHSRYILVWGKATKEKLVEWGNDKQNIFITGNPSFDEIAKRKNFVNRERLCSMFDLDYNKGIFVLATGVYHADPLPFFSSMWTRDEGEIVFRVILKALEEFPQKQLVVKVHPMENEQGYINIMYEFPHLANHVHIVKKTNLYSLLKESELLLTVGSTVDVQAMFFNKPIIVINLTNNTVPLFIPSSRYGASVEIHKEDELVPSVKSILFNESVKQRMREGQDKFICDFVGKLDGRNCKRVSNTVRQIIYGQRSYMQKEGLRCLRKCY